MAAVDQTAVALAVHEIARHPAVVGLAGPRFENGVARLALSLDLDFGSRWAAEGQSPTGVRPVETVGLTFYPSFPRSAPLPTLRADFSRDHPHIQPALSPEGLPIPCLVDGKLAEFVAVNGLSRLVDQFVLWLTKAAEGRLIDPKQGWEPMRRDHAIGGLSCDRSRLEAQVTAAGGHRLLKTDYWWRRPWAGQDASFLGEVGAPTSRLTKAAAGQRAVGGGEPSVIGSGVTALIWAGCGPVGNLLISERYFPDAVADLKDLRALARELGMAAALDKVLSMAGAQTAYNGQAFALPIILAVRRRYPLLDTQSKIELVPYLVAGRAHRGALADTTVWPLSIYERIEPALLAKLTDAPPGQAWSLLGCGSLGSKLALHRARDGAAPLICVDDAFMRPHNAARHALYPRSGDNDGWLGTKAEILADAIGGLGQSCAPINGDHRDLLGVRKSARTPWLVNTTASTVTREDLAGPELADLPRGVEACLFDRGALGYFAVEGADHNPNTMELMADLYAAAGRDAALGGLLFGQDGALARVNLGQGCGSMTMQVSDAKISLLAGVMAQALADLNAAAPEGRIDLFVREGLGLRHQRLAAPAWTRVALDDCPGWSLSLSRRALDGIEAEVARHRGVETGGVLVGFHSTIARRIYVTDVLAAPADSLRKRHEFVLGVEGLTQARQDLAVSTHGLLAFAGTWHSHLGPAAPSEKDRCSAAQVGAAEPYPMAFLIRGMDGLRAIGAMAAPPPPLQKTA
jgi:hypothetical protein